MTAGYEMLKRLREPGVYEALEVKAAALEGGIRENLKSLGLDFQMNRVGSMMTLFFTEMWERMSYYGMRGLLVLYMTIGVAGNTASWLRLYAALKLLPKTVSYNERFANVFQSPDFPR